MFKRDSRRYAVTTAGRLGSVRERYRSALVRGAGGMRGCVWSGDAPVDADAVTANGDAETGIRDGRLARLEAVLFLAREPLGARRLAKLAALADGTEARTLVELLNRAYDTGGTAFRVEEMAGGYRLLTRPQLGPWIRRLETTPAEVRLSGPALETLAVVAYRQPVLRAEVEAIRGVQCGEMLRQLMERELVRIVGRSEELGRPFQYGTTRQFLETFGLRDLDELPRAAKLRNRPEAVAHGEESRLNHGVAGEGTAQGELPEDDVEERDVSVRTSADASVAESELATLGMTVGSAAGGTTSMDEESMLGEVEAPAGTPRMAVDDDDDFDDDDYEDDEYDDDEDEDDDDDDELDDEPWEEVDDDELDEEDLDDDDDLDDDLDDDDDDWDDEEEEEDWDEED